MSFVKLDTGILDSTLWLDRDERDIFVTALLMAEPYEVEQPAEQIAADSLALTGFIAPPGWYGFVRAAGPGIVRRALVDAAAGISALVRLGSPDPESRTPDHDGRRLVRIDGGYLVMNFMRYRDKDNTTAERSRRYRERQKTINSDPSRRDAHVVTRDSSLADADADADADKAKAKAKAIQPDGCPHAEILAMYHELLPANPRIREWKGKRQANLRSRWREDTRRQSLDYWRRFFSHVAASPFLTGQRTGSNGRPFLPGLDWFVLPENFAKVIEGRYHDREIAA